MNLTYEFMKEYSGVVINRFQSIISVTAHGGDPQLAVAKVRRSPVSS